MSSDKSDILDDIPLNRFWLSGCERFIVRLNNREYLWPSATVYSSLRKDVSECLHENLVVAFFRDSRFLSDKEVSEYISKWGIDV